jgi:hypothetical protein
VGAFGVVELQSARDGFEDLLGGATQVPLLESGVVVGAEPGELGYLFTA